MYGSGLNGVPSTKMPHDFPKVQEMSGCFGRSSRHLDRSVTSTDKVGQSVKTNRKSMTSGYDEGPVSWVKRIEIEDRGRKHREVYSNLIVYPSDQRRRYPTLPFTFSGIMCAGPRIVYMYFRVTIVINGVSSYLTSSNLL